MNILDYKRKAAGHVYREGGNDERGYTSGPNDEFIWVVQGGGDNAQLVQIPNPNYVKTKTPQEQAQEVVAAKLGVPISSVVWGGAGWVVENNNGTASTYNNSGEITNTFTPRAPNEGGFLGKFFADLDRDLKLSENAPAIVGLAASYFLPGIGQALGQSLVNAGVLTGAAATPAMASTIGTALAQTGISVAQGKPLDKALGDAILSVGMGELTKAYGANVQAEISKITSNPIAQNAIFKAGTDVVTAVAQGKTGDQIVQGIGNSVISTVAGAAANEVVKNIPGINNLSEAQKNIVKTGVATSIQGGDGTKSMVNAAIKLGTNTVLDALTATPGASAANPMSLDPAQRAASTDVVSSNTNTNPYDVITNLTKTGLSESNLSKETVADILGPAKEVQPGVVTAGLDTGVVSDAGPNGGTPATNLTEGKPGESVMADTASKTGGTDTANADEFGDLQGAMLKGASGEAIKLTDAQMTDMVRKGLVFEGGDYSTKQDAANAARLAGYTQFEYDNSVYSMQPGGPTEKAVFQAVIDGAPNKKEAFRVARDLLGADKEFPYQGTNYTTALWKPIPQPDAEIIGDGSANTSRAGTRVGLPITSVEGLSYLTDQEKSVNQRIKEAYTGSTLSKIIGTPDDAVRTFIKMKDTALSPGQGVVNGIKGMSDIYGIITGDINNSLSQSMQGVLNNFDELTSDKTKNTLKTIQKLVDEAAKDGQGSAAWETLKQAVLNPETAVMTVGNALGTFFPALAASAPLVAAGVPAAIATGAFIVLNAASQGGSSGQEALEFTARQLMNDPTVSMEHALEATIMAGRKAGIPAAAISVVINSMPMGRALETAMLKVSKSSLGRGVGSEVLTEIPDETLAKIFSNYASGQDLSTGLGQTAVNAVIGAAGSAAAVHVKSDAEILIDKVSDLVKSGEASPSKITELKNEVSNLIGNVGYGTEPTLDLMSDQFFSGIISQEVAGELSLSGLSPEQIAQNLPAAIAHVESGNRIDPTFVDQFFTDDAEARQIAESLGYTNPSPEVLKSLTGPISEANAQAKLDEFLSGMTAFESGKPIGAAEAQGMVKDLGLTGLSDADAISLATKIVQSVPEGMLAADPNIKLASDAGFPDVASYTQYDGDKTAYDTDQANIANAQTATAAGFPDFAAYTQYGGDAGAYNAAQAAAANLSTAQAAGFPDYASYSQFGGNLAAYDKANNDAANIRRAYESGFPDYATFLQYEGNIFEYAAAKTAETNKQIATTSGFPDFGTYTQFNGDKASYDAAMSEAANARLATEAGFPDFAAYTQYGGDKTAYDANIAAVAAGFPNTAVSVRFKGDIEAYNAAKTAALTALNIAVKKDGVALDLRYDVNKDGKVTSADSFLLSKGTPVRTDVDASGAKTTATLDAEAKALGFPNSAAYTQYNGDVNAYNADSTAKTAGWKDAAEQIQASTAGYTNPAAYAAYLTDTANSQKAMAAGFPDYATYTKFNGNATAYETAKTDDANTKQATDAGFPNYAAYTQYGGDVGAYNAAQTNAANAQTASNAGFPDFATYNQYNGDVGAYNGALAAAANAKKATNAGFPDFATYTQFNGDKAAYEASKVAIKPTVKVDPVAKVDPTAKVDPAIDPTTKVDPTIKVDPAIKVDPIVNVDPAVDPTIKVDPIVKVDPAIDPAAKIDPTAKVDPTVDPTVKVDPTVTVDPAIKVNPIVKVDPAVNPPLTEAQISKIVLDALLANPSITPGQVQIIVNDALAANPSITPVQVQTIVDAALLKEQTEQTKKTEAAAKLSRAATAQAGISQNLKRAAEGAAYSGPVDTTTPGFANIGLKTSGEAKFEGPLEQYLKMISGNSYAAKPQETQQSQQAAPVQDQLSAQQQSGSDYFNYGQQTDIDLPQSPGTQMLYSKAGGLATPLFAGGGTTRHGRYAGGGLNVVQHAGKARIDFRTGNAVTGPGDGQSDDIPAMLADGEFVFPADVVAALGNGSTKAGSDKLYDMMHSIRAYHRSAKPRDLPPPAKKSPLDYLKKRTVRR